MNFFKYMRPMKNQYHNLYAIYNMNIRKVSYWSYIDIKYIYIYIHYMFALKCTMYNIKS